MRKYARGVARTNMIKRGLKGINDHKKGTRSYFAANWKDYVPKGE